METAVLMERSLFGNKIRQNSKTGFFCLNDLEKAGNNYRALNKMDLFNYKQWINSNPVKEFIDTIEKQQGKATETKRGKNGATWAHPFIFIDMALSIDPNLKLEVYSWIYDQLLKYRNDSGDSYKKMCGSLYENCTNKSVFHRGVSKTAQIIQKACNVDNWNNANEDQLKLRDKIHYNIALLCDILRDNNQAIRLGILKAKEN